MEWSYAKHLYLLINSLPLDKINHAYSSISINCIKSDPRREVEKGI